VTEFAGELTTSYLSSIWPEVPAGLSGQAFLTRTRTVIARQHMDRDFEFLTARNDGEVFNYFDIWPNQPQSAATALAEPSAAMIVFGLAWTVLKCRFRR
jgi:hypothetical protein